MDEPRIPSQSQQSWGALLSIVIIVLMVVVGAYYSWGKRTAEVNQFQSATESADTSEATTTESTTTNLSL